MVVGYIDGYSVIYNEKKDTVFCKNTKVQCEPLLNAFRSGFDKVQLTDTLELVKHPMGYTLGCFELSIEQAKKLILNLKNVRITRNKSGKS